MGNGALGQADAIERLPASLLAAALVASKRHHVAQSCKECLSGVAHLQDCCHTVADLKPMRDRDPCVYHEHGTDDEEAARCAAQWGTRQAYLVTLRKADKGVST